MYSDGRKTQHRWEALQLFYDFGQKNHFYENTMCGYHLILLLGNPDIHAAHSDINHTLDLAVIIVKKRPEISQKCKCKTREKTPASPCLSDMNSEVVQLSNIPVGSLKQNRDISLSILYVIVLFLMQSPKYNFLITDAR